MHFGVLIGLLLAGTSAAGGSVSGLWRQKGAIKARDVDIHHPLQSTVDLFRSKWFAIGWMTLVVAWVLHIGALALAPLSLVQAVLSGGLVSVGVLAERFFGFHLSRRQWLGLVVMAGALAALAATSRGERNHPGFAVVAIVAFEALVIALAIGLFMSLRVERLRHRRGLLLGVVAGLLLGIADVSIKAITSGTHGVLGVIGPWTLIGLLAGVCAFFASARSLQIGEAVGVIASTASAANLVGIIGGVVVFGEPLGKGAPTVVGRLLAFVLVLLAVGLMPVPARAQQAAKEATINDEFGRRSRAPRRRIAPPAAAD